MPDEPTLGEALRRLERIEKDWDRRHGELGREIDEERSARREAIKDLRELVKDVRAVVDKHSERRSADWRLVLVSVLGPLLIALVSVGTNIWIATRG